MNGQSVGRCLRDNIPERGLWDRDGGKDSKSSRGSFSGRIVDHTAITGFLTQFAHLPYQDLLIIVLAGGCNLWCSWCAVHARWVVSVQWKPTVEEADLRPPRCAKVLFHWILPWDQQKKALELGGVFAELIRQQDLSVRAARSWYRCQVLRAALTMFGSRFRWFVFGGGCAAAFGTLFDWWGIQV